MRGFSHDTAHEGPASGVFAQVYGICRLFGRGLIVFPLIFTFIGAAAATQLVAATFLSFRPVHLKLCRLFNNLVCRVIGLRVEVVNPYGYRFSGRDNYLVVANHMSYLDVLAIQSILPAYFVTSREVEQTPFLGWICRAAGCFFVERRNCSTVQQDVGAMAHTLNQKLNITFFPEGSTSDGSDFLPFKRSLLEAAVRSRCRVLPICLNYVAIDGYPVTAENRDYLAWYGDMTFFPHLMKLLTLRSATIRVSLLPPLPFRQHRSRKLLASEIRQRIREHFLPIR